MNDAVEKALDWMNGQVGPQTLTGYLPQFEIASLSDTFSALTDELVNPSPDLIMLIKSGELNFAYTVHEKIGACAYALSLAKADSDEIEKHCAVLRARAIEVQQLLEKSAFGSKIADV